MPSRERSSSNYPKRPSLGPNSSIGGSDIPNIAMSGRRGFSSSGKRLLPSVPPAAETPPTTRKSARLIMQNEIPEATTPLEDDSNSNIPTKKSRGRVAKEKQVSNNSSGRPRRTESVGSDSAQISIDITDDSSVIDPDDSLDTSKRGRGRQAKKSRESRGGGRPQKVVSEPVPDPIAQNHDEYIDLHERDDANLEAAAEQAAARNNAEADILAIPPPRRSTRTRRAPEIFITDNTSTREARPEQVTNNCRNMKHKGLGCAALDANHYPDYYDSLKNQTVCGFCNALQLESESDSMKCCSQGRVNLKECLKKLQTQPIELDMMSDLRSGGPAENFMKNIWLYNNEFSFGTLGIDRENVPHGMPVAKINGQIKYNLSDLHYPYQHAVDKSGPPRKWGQCYTITPDAAITERLDRLGKEQKKLRPATIDKIHRMLAEHNPLAKIYKHAADAYAEEKRIADSLDVPMPNFRMTLLSKRKAIEQGFTPDEGIHDHRLLVPTKEGLMQCATVHFTKSGDPTPPTEKGVHLRGRDGSHVTFGYFDPNIDPALFPLLFPFGQRGFEMGIKLEGITEKIAPAIANDDILHEDFSDDEEREEEEVRPDETGQIDEVREEHEDEADGEVLDCGEIRFRKRKGAHIFASMRQFYRYVMQVREKWTAVHHWLWWSQMLAQMYILTVYNRIEANEAAAIRQAQPNLVSILPKALIEAIKHKITNGRFGVGIGAKLGQIYFAPETFRGSRRYYQKAYADAQAICRAFGEPHLLLTFTLNSSAPEFKQLLDEGQSWADRPDIVARLFIDKEKELKKDILERNILGPVASVFQTVEHQKRGLPHLHMCIILKTPNNNYFKEKNWTPMTLTPEEYCHQYIQTEIPKLNPRSTHKEQRMKDYHDSVVTLMAHRCSAACIGPKGCTKRFPRPFSAVNYVSEETYPAYRRRPPAPNATEKENNPEAFGEIYNKKDKNGAFERIIDNRSIVPHNRFLLMKYKCHINVEWVQGDGTARYITKYITKGCDLALVQVNRIKDAVSNIVNYDEFEEMRCGVYRTSSEAALAIFGHKIFSKAHLVETLYIHEPGNVKTVYVDGQEEKAAEREQERIDRNEEKKTKLTEYFTLNETLKEEATDYSYGTISQAFWWNKNSKTWIRRKNRCKKLIRIGNASAGNPQLQAIRLLLLTINGPTSFDFLKLKDDGTYFPTFVDAAIGRGLLADDTLWDRTVGDALPQIRSLFEKIRWFALFIANNSIKKPKDLLEKYFNQLTTWHGLTEDAKRDRLMRRIEITLRIHGSHPDDRHESACQKHGLPKPRNFALNTKQSIDCEYFREDFMRQFLADEDGDTSSASNSYHASYIDSLGKCTTEQKPFVERIFAAIDADKFDETVTRCFFLTGEGGTGKTFTYNTIIAGMKANKRRILSCATTGIAAQLLIEGSTVHKRFNVPIDVKDDTVPRIDRHSNYAAVLNAADVIIIDEVSMQDRYVLEYLDRLLKSICQTQFKELPFGGKVVIIGGDWKQLLPVIPGKSSEVQFSRSVKQSELWKEFETIRLTINKRQNAGDEKTKAFSRFMRKVATGVTTNHLDRVELPKDLLLYEKNRIIDFVFPAEAMANPLGYDRSGKSNLDKINASAILCPTNAECNNTNNILMDKLPGEAHVFLSIDQPQNDNNLDCLSVYAADKCVENLNKICPSGMPPHELQIKKGAIMMLIKNLSVIDGLCNGTRVQVVNFIRNPQTNEVNALLCHYICGPRIRKEIVLYKTDFEHGGGTTGENEAAFKWRRWQFPLRSGFVMTINKAQGQTLDRVGLLLQNSACFSHGQLYVALSRVRDPDSIRILLKHGQTSTQNIVYQAAIDKSEMDEAYKMAEEDMEVDDEAACQSAISAEQAFSQRAAEEYEPLRVAFEADVMPDGNCFFRAVAYSYLDFEEGHPELRRYAVEALERIDFSGTDEQKEAMKLMIIGSLEHGSVQWQNQCNRSISTYARRYTANLRVFSGEPEAQALANHIGRPIVIINVTTQQERQFRADRGDFEERETVNIYHPGKSVVEPRIIINKTYDIIWTWIKDPLVVRYYHERSHFTAIYCARH